MAAVIDTPKDTSTVKNTRKEPQRDTYPTQLPYLLAMPPVSSLNFDGLDFMNMSQLLHPHGTGNPALNTFRRQQQQQGTLHDASTSEICQALSGMPVTSSLLPPSTEFCNILKDVSALPLIDFQASVPKDFERPPKRARVNDNSTTIRLL